MSSDAAWRIGHRAALRPTAIAGAISVLCCLVSIAIPGLRHPISVLIAASVMLTGALVSIPAAHHAIRRASPARSGTP